MKPNTLNKRIMAMFGLQLPDHVTRVVIHIRPGEWPVVQLEVSNGSLPLKKFKVIGTEDDTGTTSEAKH